MTRSAIRTRDGDAGCRQVRTRGMVAAAFDHWDTRAGDPNLHTHVVVANKVQGPDGVWRSLDGRTVHAAVVTVSELYDTLLADELARRLPVETTRVCQHLTRATRPPKTVRRLADLLADWSHRARALTEIEPRDLAARALTGTYGRALHAHDVGSEVRAAMVAQVLADVSTKRSVWTT
ncbi:MAG: relaxase domain-containing protein [Actinomycetes bacterium]